MQRNSMLERDRSTAPSSRLTGQWVVQDDREKKLSSHELMTKLTDSMESRDPLAWKAGSYEGGRNKETGDREGHGTQVYFTGHCFEGQWDHGRKHGGGVYRFADGEVYEGQYVDDRREGRGTCVSHARTSAGLCRIGASPVRAESGTASTADTPTRGSGAAASGRAGASLGTRAATCT